LKFEVPDPGAIREMLEKLNDDLLRRLAIGKLEGYQNNELADRLGISQRAVERKLNLIRQKWEGELKP
jgi:DNA-directed RNA polymerase specialized sigma24 family protein